MANLYEKVYGCLMGGIIGDAMGASVEFWHYKKIKEKFGILTEFVGNGTDDSLLRLILCDVIIKNEGYVDADHWAQGFVDYGEKYEYLYYYTVKNMYFKLKENLVLPVHAGLDNMPSSSSAMCISPMGLLNACNPRQAALETFDIAGILHNGAASYCRDAACAMAAAIAEAMKPDATVDSIIEASTKYLHQKSAAQFIKKVEKALNLAKETNDYELFREKYYETELRFSECDSLETVPAALAMFYLANGDAQNSIIYAANFGRDTDTLATMAGSIAGAYQGIQMLRKDWVEQVEKADDPSKKLEQNEDFKYTFFEAKTLEFNTLSSLPNGDTLQKKVANELVRLILKKAEEAAKPYDVIKQMA